MIRNIVFDMGGVLIRFDRDCFIRRLGLPEADGRILMDEVFRSLEWAALDRGTIVEEEAAASICRRLPRRLHDAAGKLICAWDRPILPEAGMHELIAELKEMGYPIYLLSNASKRQHEYWPRVPENELFDGTLISADVGIVKPQPEIYRLLCDTFDLLPAECCFIDDLPQNAEGACFAGMAGLVYHGDTARLRAALRESGVPVGSAKGSGGGRNAPIDAPL